MVGKEIKQQSQVNIVYKNIGSSRQISWKWAKGYYPDTYQVICTHFITISTEGIL